MKRIAVILLLCISFAAKSQDYNTVYYNSNWEITSMKYGKYYRNSGFNPNNLKFDSLVIDRFMDGSIEMIGNYSNGMKEGEFIYYYPNQSTKLISNYSKNLRSGIWTLYYENGQIDKVVDYSHGKERMIQYFDKNGKELLKNLTGKFSLEFYFDPKFETFSYSSDDDNLEMFTLKGQFKKGYKDGQWILVRNIPTFIRHEDSEWKKLYTSAKVLQLSFTNGNINSGWIYQSDNTRIKYPYDTLTYVILEPEKINMTESLFHEPGQVIKQNYVLKAIADYNNKIVKKVELENESELLDFFDLNYSHYAQNCSDTVTIKINLVINDKSEVNVQSISPDIGSGFKKEVNRVIALISKIKSHSSNYYTFNYRIRCVDELDFKK